MMHSPELIKHLRDSVARYAAVDSNPVSESSYSSEEARSIQYSKKDIQAVLGCSTTKLDRWIKQLEREEDVYFLRDGRGHYLVDPEQVPLFLKKAGIETIPELRVYRDDYEVPVMVVNTSKGGIAKSTTTLHLAVESALDVRKRQRVLLIDGDPQGSLAKQLSRASLDTDFNSFLSIFEEGASLTREERLSPKMQSKFRSQILDLLLETHLDNLWLLPSDMENASIEIAILQATAKYGIDNAMMIVKDVLVTPVKEDFDIIFFDTSPAPNSTTASIYFASNHITFVVTGRNQDYRSYIEHKKYLARTLESTTPNGFQGVHSVKTIITKHVDKNDVLSSIMRTNVSRIMVTDGSDVYSQIIHESRKYEEAAAAQLPLQLLDSKKDNSYRDSMSELKKLYSQFSEVINPHLFTSNGGLE
jgi:cellulose biosynthesis protein BcsQ